MAWNPDLTDLKKVGDIITASGMTLEVIAVSGIIQFSDWQYQRVHVKLRNENEST